MPPITDFSTAIIAIPANKINNGDVPYAVLRWLSQYAMMLPPADGNRRWEIGVYRVDEFMAVCRECGV